MADHHRSGRGRSGNLLIHVLLSAGGLVMVFPFLWQLLTAFKSYPESVRVPPTLVPEHWRVDNFAEVFASIPFGDMFLNSVLVTVGRTAGQVVLCAMAGYAFARLRFPGRDALFVAFLAVLMVPAQLFLIPQYEIMQRLGWLNTLQALVVPGVFSAFGTFLVRQFFLSLPTEMEEAARVDGANPFQVFWYVMLPLASPALLALSIFTILWSWNDLLWPLVVNTDPEQMPLSAGLATLIGQHDTQYPVLMAGATLAMLPIVVLFVVLQRRFVESVAFTGSKG